MRMKYLLDLDLRKLPGFRTDVLVIGVGVAGLSAAIAAAAEGAGVMATSKLPLSDSNTAQAQGGIAAALQEGDSPEKHFQDTVAAGDGLCDPEAARVLVTEGPERVRELISWGAQFDSSDGKLEFGREGAHSLARIVHARGDATGAELERALAEKAGSSETVELVEGLFAVDLLHDEGKVYGAVFLEKETRRLLKIEAGATVLATGGMGQLYRETTNSASATADGIAMAYRAGAEIVDIEFIQFHPTALYLAGARRMLLSEAMRGEGAHLLNTSRERFMPGRDERAELAPRDIVTLAIISEMERTRSPHVYLDLRHLDEKRVRERFPNITEVCSQYGLDITSELIPVRPAAHYAMGGVKTDLSGRTNLRRLFACGEAACTGVHGANRLASNSLLEGLVFGRRTGRAASEAAGPASFRRRKVESGVSRAEIPLDLEDVIMSLKGMMWRQVGPVRAAHELESAERALGHWRTYVLKEELSTARGMELANMLVAAGLVTRAALMREESRGGHRRSDFERRDDANWSGRIVLTINDFL